MITSKSQELVGVVDVTASRDWSVLEYLPPDADEFLYVSGIAVLNSFRFLLSPNTNLLCMIVWFKLFWVLLILTRGQWFH